MTDWHCHLLPALDDGAADIEESAAMARLLFAAGYTEIYCTPHMMRGGFEARNDQVLQTLADTQACFNIAGIGVQLLPGREYYLDEYFPDYLANPLPLGESRFLLIELPPRALNEEFVKQSLFKVVSAGFTPVIAHPERTPALSVSRRGPRRSGFFGRLFNSESPVESETFTPSRLLEYLIDLGCGFQGNIGSMVGYYGDHVRQQAEIMTAMGLYDRMGSDAHSPHHAETILVNPAQTL